MDHEGEVVTKDALMKTVWGETFVEESNLSHNIYLLRKTLKNLGGENFIETVPRRGYRFAGETHEATDEEEIVIERHTTTRSLLEEIPFETEEEKERKGKKEKSLHSA